MARLTIHHQSCITDNSTHHHHHHTRAKIGPPNFERVINRRRWRGERWQQKKPIEQNYFRQLRKNGRFYSRLKTKGFLYVSWQTVYCIILYVWLKHQGKPTGIYKKQAVLPTSVLDPTSKNLRTACTLPWRSLITNKKFKKFYKRNFITLFSIEKN